MTQRRRRAPQTRRAPIAGDPPSTPQQREGSQLTAPPAYVEPEGPFQELPAITSAKTIERQRTPLIQSQPRIRLVRFRFGWGYEDTAPAIVFDEQIAVLLPPKTPIAPGAQLTFRAPDGGWSIGKARPGDGIGEYQEV